MIPTHLKTIKHFIYKQFIKPRSRDQDSQRREFILNVLLAGLVVAAVAAFIVDLVNYFSTGVVHNSSTLTITTIFMVLTVGLLWISRRGWYKLAAYVVIGLLTLAATQLVVGWSFELPGAQLAYVMVIVVAGVLLNARTALLFAGLVSVLLFGEAYAQLGGYFHPNLSWLAQPFGLGDAVGYVAIFCFIGLVSWLSNREIDRSLTRARKSEAALARERDNLEIKVVERTRELEQTQLERAIELQRFAEFGRLSAGLLHEVANPLTAASLNLEQAGSSRGRSEPVVLAMQNLQQLQRYVEAARKQLKKQSIAVAFSVRDELDQVVSLLAHKARGANVELSVHYAGKFRLYGDPVKFSQLAANLVANAIESYEVEAPANEKRRVEVAVTQASPWIILTVQDWGRGITPAQLQHLFEPFYSSKSASGNSLGIGLAMVKQFAEEDFSGRIAVTSTPETGTQFVVRLRGARKR